MAILRKINFDEIISDLTQMRETITIYDKDELEKNLHYQAEMCYQLKSLLLGLQPFLNNTDYALDYITEKCETVARIAAGHHHDLQIGEVHLDEDKTSTET